MFEQLTKLPAAQQAGILAAILVLIGVGTYFLLIEPELTEAEGARAALKSTMEEVEGLRAKASSQALESLRKRRDSLVELDKENRKMLPAAEELPDLIDAVQSDAHGAGLTVKRFDRLQPENRDLIDAIPVKMQVEGSASQLIAFLRIYAGPNRRIINLHELAIEDVPLDMANLRAELQKAKPRELMNVAGQGPPRTAEEKLAENIELRELASKNARIRASFTAYAFLWTGEPAKGDAAGSQAKAKKKRT